VSEQATENLKFLAQALSGHPSPVAWAELSSGDWQGLVEGAERQRVAPLLYQQLQSSGWPEAPPHVARQLRSAYYHSSGLNLMLFEELGRVLGALAIQANEPKVVLLKGAALASTLYRNIALRPMSDIDLLVPRERMDAAVGALRSLGYRDYSPEMAPGLAEVTHYHAAMHGGPHGQVGVELHWGLISGESDWRSPSLSWFWSETEPWNWESPTAGRLEALQLKPTPHLLYLAAHLLLQHGSAGAQLVWYYDLHLLLRDWGSRVEWEALRRRASEFRWTAALRGALEATRELFGTTLPPGFVESLDVAGDSAASRLVQSKADPMKRGARVWLELGSLDWSGRARLVRSILWPSADYMRWRYAPRPAWAWPLYYPYRLGVVLAELLGSLKGLLRRRGRRPIT
jgi:hypothetical protein